mgnify:CR=1 FL=1
MRTEKQYIDFTHNQVNYHALNTLNRKGVIVERAEKDVKRKQRKYSGLVNVQTGFDLISDQAEWYKNHVNKNNIKELTFFNKGDKAAKYEIKVLEKLG